VSVQGPQVAGGAEMDVSDGNVIKHVMNKGKAAKRHGMQPAGEVDVSDRESM
jgi:hypothetical protein